MKAIVGSVVAATAASACCLGPVVLSLVGAGAWGAAAVRLEPLRPLFLVITGVLLVAGIFLAYHRAPGAACGSEGSCRPGGSRTARTLLWLAAAVLLLVTFPYYVTWFI